MRQLIRVDRAMAFASSRFVKISILSIYPPPSLPSLPAFRFLPTGLQPTPDVEITFWKTKASKLNAVYDQLQSQRVKKVRRAFQALFSVQWRGTDQVWSVLLCEPAREHGKGCAGTLCLVSAHWSDSSFSIFSTPRLVYVFNLSFLLVIPLPSFSCSASPGTQGVGAGAIYLHGRLPASLQRDLHGSARSQ